ncbi:MAG: VWA domain-containing protein [Acidobacteria bacterium]|nr:VWA domain-containing protein [Acidobacteriota bacterium]
MFLIIPFLVILCLNSTTPQIPVQTPVQKQQEPQKKACAAGPDDEIISLETNLVVLNVTVTDARAGARERYVSGLQAEDFNVFEDNARQKIESFGFEETPFASAILLDTSASMERKLSLERAACANFVEGIREGDCFAIFSFGNAKVRKLQDFTEIRDIPDAVWDMRADGNTPLYDAIAQASEALAGRRERRRAILIVSDGADTQSRVSLDQALRKALAAHVLVYSVDMSDASVYGSAGRDSGAEVLKSLAVKTGARFFKSPGGSQLREAFSSTVEELRHQYTITYESTNDRQDGKWRAVSVKVKDPLLNLRTRQGYYARKKKD